MGKSRTRKKPKDDLQETSERLGFHRGDYVRFSHRFFSNHNMKEVDLGAGIVTEKVMPAVNALPALIVDFPFNHAFFVEDQLKALLEGSSSKNGVIKITIRVHPLYLEKA